MFKDTYYSLARTFFKFSQLRGRLDLSCIVEHKMLFYILHIGTHINFFSKHAWPFYITLFR